MLETLINKNLDTFEVIFLLDGGRVEGILYSLHSILMNPLGYLFDPEMFEPLGGKLAVSAPITFVRTFGIFGLIYIYHFVKFSGPGNLKMFLVVFLITSIYSPNASSLVLLACIIAYKEKNI